MTYGSALGRNMLIERDIVRVMLNPTKRRPRWNLGLVAKKWFPKILVLALPFPCYLFQVYYTGAANRLGRNALKQMAIGLNNLKDILCIFSCILASSKQNFRLT